MHKCHKQLEAGSILRTRIFEMLKEDSNGQPADSDDTLPLTYWQCSWDGSRTLGSDKLPYTSVSPTTTEEMLL